MVRHRRKRLGDWDRRYLTNLNQSVRSSLDWAGLCEHMVATLSLHDK